MTKYSSLIENFFKEILFEDFMNSTIYIRDS